VAKPLQPHHGIAQSGNNGAVSARTSHFLTLRRLVSMPLTANGYISTYQTSGMGKKGADVQG
jgi:hypothetical protein